MVFSATTAFFFYSVGIPKKFSCVLFKKAFLFIKITLFENKKNTRYKARESSWALSVAEASLTAIPRERECRAKRVETGRTRERGKVNV